MSLLYANEMNGGWVPLSFRVGLVTRKSKPMKGSELSAPLTFREQGGVETELISKGE